MDKFTVIKASFILESKIKLWNNKFVRHIILQALSANR